MYNLERIRVLFLFVFCFLPILLILNLEYRNNYFSFMLKYECYKTCNLSYIVRRDGSDFSDVPVLFMYSENRNINLLLSIFNTFVSILFSVVDSLDVNLPSL